MIEEVRPNLVMGWTVDNPVGLEMAKTAMSYPIFHPISLHISIPLHSQSSRLAPLPHHIVNGWQCLDKAPKQKAKHSYFHIILPDTFNHQN